MRPPLPDGLVVLPGTDVEGAWERFEVFEALPRQGPGDRACAERALALCDELPATPRILDLGCGVGAQTMQPDNADLRIRTGCYFKEFKGWAHAYSRHWDHQSMVEHEPDSGKQSTGPDLSKKVCVPAQSHCQRIL